MTSKMFSKDSIVAGLFFCFTLPHLSQGSCGQVTYLASSKAKVISTNKLSGYSNCTWIIKPATALSPSSYLEMEWIYFRVPSQMPHCANEYVEININRQNHSLGRFCSKNTRMVVPFTMYSMDGFASIRFQLDLEKGAKFALKYSLKQKKRHTCRQNFHPSSIDVTTIFARPITTNELDKQCDIVLTSSEDQDIKIIFMDFDFDYPAATCYSGIEVRGSQNPYEAGNTILSKSCGKREPFSIFSSHRRLDLTVDLWSKDKTARGLIAGVIRYGKTNHAQGQFAKLTFDSKSGLRPTLVVGEQKEPDMDLALALAVGLIVGGVVLCFIIPVLIYCCKGPKPPKKSASYKEMPRMQAVQEVR